MLALIPFALYRGSQVPEAEASWWNESWQYRQSIAVTNNTTQQANVYISVSLDTTNTSKFQADCGDLRFTKQNGQLLPYFIVSGCGTTSTSVHVQRDTFPAGEQTFYAYYGNPSADNGFLSADFLMAASSYTVGGTGSEEIGPGPVAYWKFDEGSGGTVFDSAGDNEGTISGALWQTNCATGNCLTFDGINDYVSRVDQGTTDPLRLNGAANLTLESWINVDNLSASNELFIISKYDYSVQQGYSLQVRPNGGFRFDINGSANAKATSGGYVSEHTWHHVAAVFKDGNTMQIFVDGNLKETFSIASTTLIGSSRPLAMGTPSNSLGSDTFSFSGAIDELKIFPYALTEDQIKTEYNLGTAAVIGTGPTVAPPAGGTLSDSLVAHWAFDERYGQTAHDSIGNYHGTFGASASLGSDDPAWKPASECKVNGCLSFDGGDGINAGDILDSSLSGDDKKFSISAWIKPSATMSNGFIVSKYRATGGYTQFLFRIQSGAKLGFSWYSTTGAYRNVSANTPITDTNHWYRVVVVYDGTIDTNDGLDRISIYVDGKEEITNLVTTSGALADIVDSSADIEIGSGHNVGNYFFNGLIDEVKIYNTALTADQVKQDMNAGASVAYSVGSEEADELADGAGAPPVAEWKFDEKQGTVAYDSSGNANDGTVNGATWKSGCQQGACLVFDGVDDSIAVASSASVETSALTFEAWIKSSNISIQNSIINKHTSPSAGWWVRQMSNGTIRFLVVNGTGAQYFTTSQALTSGRWYHVTGTYDGTSVKIYINGQLANGATTLPENTGDIVTSTAPLRIGVQWYGSGEYFQGQIDHIKIYDYARTPAQIAYDYNRGAPVAHWKLDECEGAVAHDASGNENHGTITIGASGSQTMVGTCSTSGAWANGASGKYEGSLNFDGFDDAITIPDTTNSVFDSSLLSIALWVKAGPYDGGYEGILSKASRNNTYTGPWTIMRSDTAFRFSINGGNTISAPADYINNWVHAVFTYDGSTIKSFINGSPSAQQSYTGGITPTDDSIMIGAGYGLTNNRYINGQIDDVRIYNYALSPAQVRKVYNQGFGVLYSPSD